MQAYWKTLLSKAVPGIAVALHALATSAAEPSSPATAAFPSRPVQIVVGFSPGGFPDIAARFIAPALADIWKQQVIVENRPGGGSSVAARQIAGSTPDGHMILFTTAGHSAAPALYAKLGYDPAQDFSGVAILGTTPLLLVVAQNSDKRIAQLPDVPAITEIIPGYSPFRSGVGLFGPAQLPEAILRRLNNETVKGITSATGRARVLDAGYEPIPGTPDEFTALIAR